MVPPSGSHTAMAPPSSAADDSLIERSENVAPSMENP
jgi:hypothetical protein